MAGDKYGHSVGLPTALNTSYKAIEVKADAATDPRSRGIPNDCRLGWLHGAFSDIATAVSVTWFLSADADGDVPVTDEVTETWLAGQTESTQAGSTTVIDRPWSLSSFGKQGSIWVWAKVDAGTAVVVPRIYWSRE